MCLLCYQKCFFLLYADNTIIYCNSKLTLPSAYRQHLPSFIQHLSSLLSFILNLPWTHQNLSGHYSQILHGSPIERFSVYIYLGIWIDDKFTFNFHINYLSIIKITWLPRVFIHFWGSHQQTIYNCIFICTHFSVLYFNVLNAGAEFRTAENQGLYLLNYRNLMLIRK